MEPVSCGRDVLFVLIIAFLCRKSASCTNDHGSFDWLSHCRFRPLSLAKGYEPNIMDASRAVEPYLISLLRHLTLAIKRWQVLPTYLIAAPFSNEPSEGYYQPEYCVRLVTHKRSPTSISSHPVKADQE